MKTFEKILIWYYGIIQIIHLLGNLGTLVAPYTTIYRVAPTLSSQGVMMFFFSTLIDFFIASPLGILFFYGYLTRKKVFEVFLDISITTATISALYYVYVLVLFHAWEWTPLNTFIATAFSPFALLYVLYLSKRLHRKSFIA